MSRFISNRTFVLAAAAMMCVAAMAQSEADAKRTAIKVVEEEMEKHEPLFRGVTLSVDLVGPATNFLSDYGCYEAALRVNLKDKYFPIFELGYGMADRTDIETNIRYKTSAPYARAGIDFNMLRNKRQGNRLYVGLRGGFTSYSYDNTVPSLTDPVWGGSTNVDVKGVKSNMVWAEVVCGLEAEVFHNLHMGWSLRYKSRLVQKSTPYGEPWYVPGYGMNGGSCFGATYNLIFDLPLWKGGKQNLKKQTER